MLKALCHSSKTGWVTVDDISSVSDLRADPANVVWAELDIDDLGPSDVDIIAEEFDLDEFAVADSVNPRQRPKLETYDTHLFAVLHQLDEIRDQLEQRQISCFVGEGYFLVIHDGAERTLTEARGRLKKVDEVLHSPEYMLYALLDTVVDDYESIADTLELDIEELEEQALMASGVVRSTRDTPRLPEQRHMYSIKQQVSRLRRYALPLSRVLERVVNRTDHRITDDRMHKMFQDVYDHILRIQAQVQNVDDLTVAVLDLTRGEQADTLNQINKKLTAWAAIIAAPTLVTSFYGMNVALLPRSGTTIALVAAVLLMTVSGVVLYWNFKTRGWL